MIKKEYFPTQEVPSRVKDRVMNKIYGKTKTFRLISLIRYKLMVPALALLFIVTGGYVYLQMPKKIVVSNISGAVTTISTSTTVQTSTVVTTTQVVTDSSSDEDLLQQKLAEAEIVLNNLSTNANQEETITL